MPEVGHHPLQQCLPRSPLRHITRPGHDLNLIPFEKLTGGLFTAFCVQVGKNDTCTEIAQGNGMLHTEHPRCASDNCHLPIKPEKLSGISSVVEVHFPVF